MLNIYFCESKEFYEKLLGNELAGESQFTFLFDAVEKRLKLTECKLLISTLYSSPVVNAYIFKAKTIGVKTVLIADGIIEWSNLFNNPFLVRRAIKLYHPIIHDYFLVPGDFEATYFTNTTVKAINFVPYRLVNKDKEINMSRGKKFLITTANTAYFSDTEKNMLVLVLNNLIAVLNSKSIDYKFRIYDQELLEHLNTPSQIFNETKTSFSECLKDVGSIITTPSSITLEAISMQRNVCHLLYRNSPIFLNTAWNITSLSDIESVIDSMLQPKEDLLEFQHSSFLNYKGDDLITILNDITLNQEKINDFVKVNADHLVESPFNLNVEMFLRRLYWKAKSNLFILPGLSKLRRWYSNK